MSCFGICFFNSRECVMKVAINSEQNQSCNNIDNTLNALKKQYINSQECAGGVSWGPRTPQLWAVAPMIIVQIQWLSEWWGVPWPPRPLNFWTSLDKNSRHRPHIEGSVHKGSISIYFRFWDFYTIRWISTSRWRQFFSNFATQKKL